MSRFTESIQFPAIWAFFQPVGPLVIPIKLLSAGLASDFDRCRADEFYESGEFHVL